MHVLYNVVDARPLKVASVVRLTEHRAGRALHMCECALP